MQCCALEWRVICSVPHPFPKPFPMASIERRGTSWRAVVSKDGKRQSKTFPTRREALAWATDIESEMNRTGRGLVAAKTGIQMLDKFIKDVAPKRKGSRWEILRCKAFKRADWARKPLADIGQPDLAEWRDTRQTEVSDGTVLREMTLMHTVFAYARDEWKWINVHPMDGVKRPPAPKPRKRLITQEEIAGMLVALSYSEQLPIETMQQQIAVMFLLALETGMRAGEMHSLRWEHVHLDQKWLRLILTKNGDSRDVPLSTEAIRLIKRMEGISDKKVFTVKAGSRDEMFRECRDAAGMSGFRFHDSRANAITMLATKLEILDLARMIGHRDPRSLMRYYRISAADIAKKLN
jgi:integrase